MNCPNSRFGDNPDGDSGAKDSIVIATMGENMTRKIIPEGSSRTIALEAGEIDFIVEAEVVDPSTIHLPIICSDNAKRRAGEVIQANLTENLGIDVTLDPGEQAAIFEKLSARLNKLCSQVPLYQPLTLRAFKKVLGGVKISDAGAMRFEDCYWEE